MVRCFEVLVNSRSTGGVRSRAVVKLVGMISNPEPDNVYFYQLYGAGRSLAFIGKSRQCIRPVVVLLPNVCANERPS